MHSVNRAVVVHWARSHRLLADAAFGVVAVAFSTGASVYGPTAVSHRLSLAGALFAGFSVVTVTFRRQWPVAVFGVLAALTLTALIIGLSAGPTGGAFLVAAWTLAVMTPRSTSLTACALASVAFLVRVFTSEGISGLGADNLNVVILTLFAAAAGIAVRDRRAYLAALVERAERAERSRETEAGRRVAEERLRIARDLHDSLAHHMAVVNVQTGVAGHLLRTDPTAAEVALGHARSAAGQVLDELGTVLGVLRSRTDAESTEPAPSLARLPGLVEPLRAAGMDLRTTVVGQPRAIPSVTDQAAYRLIQEALTNAGKHAAGSQVRLTVSYLESSLRLEVTNSAGRPVIASARSDSETPGFGLAGMRERCAAVGGELETGSMPDGGYRVVADLPTVPAGSAGSAAGPVR